MEKEKKVEEKKAVKKEEQKKPTAKKGNANPKRRPQRGGGRKKNDRFEERVVSINRIAKTVKGGRRMRFSALVVVGDPNKHIVGFGTAKALEVPDAIKKALEKARKNLFKVPMAKGDTFPFEITGNFGSVNVFLKPANEGTGVIAGGPVRAVLELSGVKNIYSKVYGSRTPINIVRATIDGIEQVNKINRSAAIRGKRAKDLLS